MINKEKFYTLLKLDPTDNALFKKRLLNQSTISNSQLSGMDSILDEWILSHGNDDLRWLAYMLATTYHETNKTMIAIEEIGKGKGKGRPYGTKVKHSGLPYSLPNKIYYGRGLVQLTWYENYELMGRLLHIPLLEQPELALNRDIAVRIMFEGMLKGSSSTGDFTGKCLEQYFNDKVEDWIGARKIINGRDRAEDIAGYGKKFYSYLQNAII